MLSVGTSGWQYRHWRSRFYPRDVASTRWLEYYAARFATVEINNTFYRLPSRQTFAEWYRRLPADFVAVIKASNYLTHYRRLREPQEPVERLLSHAAPLAERLGAVLLQLPPDMKSAPERLDETLAAFNRRAKVAVEPRHESWWNDEVCSVLRAHGAALCFADRGSRPIAPLWRTTDWCYLRFHHGRGSPPSCYGRAALHAWVGRLVDLYGSEVTGYVFFNNDGNGCALRDAIAFAGLAERAGCDVTRVPARADVKI
ncbi:MAG TPA: DUF72 domain-containing protein [Acidimicrobiia bacterium]|nr:DUF72 domain-containing protein [Acidimicrobiia bacterium]